MTNGLPDGGLHKLDPRQRYSLRVVLLIAAVVLVAIPFATLLFQVLAKGPLTRLDGSLANRLNDATYAHPAMVRVVKAVTWLGGVAWLTLVAVAGTVFAATRRQSRLALFIAVTCLGGAIVNSLVKLAVARPRPAVDHPIATALGKSFPSGHAMSSTVVYGALLVAFLPAVPRRYRPAVVISVTVIVLAIGSSRLVLGVHFLSDVLGGFVLGLAWLSGAVAVFETWRVEEGRGPSEPLVEGVEPEAGPALRGDTTNSC
jgi:undecaprenyl-diphosphatase